MSLDPVGATFGRGIPSGSTVQLIAGASTLTPAINITITLNLSTCFWSTVLIHRQRGYDPLSSTFIYFHLLYCNLLYFHLLYCNLLYPRALISIITNNVSTSHESSSCTDLSDSLISFMSHIPPPKRSYGLAKQSYALTRTL